MPNKREVSANVVSEGDLESSARFGEAMRSYLDLVTIDGVQMQEALAAVTAGWSQEERGEFSEDLSAQGIYDASIMGPLKIALEPEENRIGASEQSLESPKEQPQPEQQPETELEVEPERPETRERTPAEQEADTLYRRFLNEVASGGTAQEVYSRLVQETTSDEGNDAFNVHIERYNNDTAHPENNIRSEDQHEGESRPAQFSRLAEELGSRDRAFEQVAEGLSKQKQDQLKRQLRKSGRWNAVAQFERQGQVEPEAEPQTEREAEPQKPQQEQAGPEEPPARQPEVEQQPQPDTEPVLDNAASFDREALMREASAGTVGETPYWIGPRGEAYVLFDDQPIEVNDRGRWKFRRSGEKYWDAQTYSFVDERPPERPQQAQPEVVQPQQEPEPAEVPPAQQPQPEQQAPFDREALLRQQPAGSVGTTSYWIGPRGEAYVSSPDHDKPIEINDRGSWKFGQQGEKYWDAQVHGFVDVRPPERQQQADAPAAAPAAPAALERLRRPDREPDGEIDDRDYWVDQDGSAIIEDERDTRKVYRVQQGGIHWVPTKGDLENRKENRRDRTGLVWDGYGWQEQKRSEWGSESVTQIENAPPLQPTIEQTRVPAARRPETGSDLNYRVARANTTSNRITTDIAAAIAEPKIGSVPSGLVIEGEKERVTTAIKRLATADPEAFERAQRALSSFSSFAEGEYKRAESAVDQQARFDDIPHTEYIEILREPDPERRAGMFRSHVESRLELFGALWNRMTFGLYARRKAGRMERTSELLRERVVNVEAEIEKRRGFLRTILGI